MSSVPPGIETSLPASITSWRGFIHYGFPPRGVAPPSIGATSSTTASESRATTTARAVSDKPLALPPPVFHYCDQTLTTRLADSFLNGVESNGIAFPREIMEGALWKAGLRLRVNVVQSEWDAMSLFDTALTTLLDDVVRYIFGHFDEPYCVTKRTTPPGHNTQQSDATWSVCPYDVTAGVEDNAALMHVQHKKYRDLRKQCGEAGFRTPSLIDTTKDCGPADAMVYNMLLQMQSLSRSPRHHDFGLFAAGPLYIFCQSVSGSYGTALLTSPPLSHFLPASEDPSDTLEPVIAAPILVYLLAILCQDLRGFELDRTHSEPQVPLARLRLPSEDRRKDPRRPARLEIGESMQTAILDDGYALSVEASGTWIDLKYSSPGLSPIPRPIMRVTFTPTPKLTSSRSVPPPRPRQSSRLASSSPSSSLLPHLTSSNSSNDAPLQLPRPSKSALKAIRAFLKSPYVDGRLFSTYNPFKYPDEAFCVPSPLPQFTLDLYANIAAGRTGDIWRARVAGLEGVTEVIVKMLYAKHVASVAREALFYESVFPDLEGLSALVPTYYGTYASAVGGWYAIVLGDAGERMEGATRGSWPEDEGLLEAIRQAEQTLKDAGIVHGDWRPPNVLRGTNGGVRVIDFGQSTLRRRR